MGYLCLHLHLPISLPSPPPRRHHRQLPFLPFNSRKSEAPTCRYVRRTFPCSSLLLFHPQTPAMLGGLCWGRRRRRRCTQLRASKRESPYDVLGVSPAATPQEIKRAYRKMALKYHPDVNKEANSQEKFMRIKHAYNTLINSNQRSDYSSTYTERNTSWKPQEDEEFYGFGNFLRDIQITIGDFVRDLQAEFQNWEASVDSQKKPKSLWEELADIGEEFVDFLEKELKVSDLNDESNYDIPQNGNSYDSKKAGDTKTGANKESSIEDNIDEIEAALAQLKKELGL